MKTQQTSRIGFIRALARNAQLQTEQLSKQSEIAHNARLKTEARNARLQTEQLSKQLEIAHNARLKTKQPSKQISKRNWAILLIARDF